MTYTSNTDSQVSPTLKDFMSVVKIHIYGDMLILMNHIRDRMSFELWRYALLKFYSFTGNTKFESESDSLFISEWANCETLSAVITMYASVNMDLGVYVIRDAILVLYVCYIILTLYIGWIRLRVGIATARNLRDEVAIREIHKCWQFRLNLAWFLLYTFLLSVMERICGMLDKGTQNHSRALNHRHYHYTRYPGTYISQCPMCL